MGSRKILSVPFSAVLFPTATGGAGSATTPTFEFQYYASVLPPENALGKALNRALLGKINSAWWQEIFYIYLGR